MCAEALYSTEEVLYLQMTQIHADHFDHLLLKQYPLPSNPTIWAQNWNALITLPWELINTGIYLHDPLDINEFIHSFNQQVHIKYLLCINSYIRIQMVPAFTH